MEEKLYNLCYWCKNLNQIDNYFYKLENTFKHIKEKGYKSQMELNRNILDKLFYANDEVQIYIDSDGKYILGSGGTHRILIAQILNINKVPVIIKGAHLKWVLYCVRKHRKDIIKSIKEEVNV